MRKPVTVNLVELLIANEADSGETQANLAWASKRVINKLEMHMSKTIGREGFQTLRDRAAKLTNRDYPAIDLVLLMSDDHYTTLPSEATKTHIVHIFNLLITFIGEDLTVRIIGTIWPEQASNVPTVRETEQA